MGRSLSHSVPIVLYAGLALFSVQDAALAQTYSDTTTAPFPGAHRLGGARSPYRLSGDRNVVGGFHGDRPVARMGWRYGPGFGGVPMYGPRFGGVPVYGPRFGGVPMYGPRFGGVPMYGPRFGGVPVYGPRFGGVPVYGPGFGGVPIGVGGMAEPASPMPHPRRQPVDSSHSRLSKPIVHAVPSSPQPPAQTIVRASNAHPPPQGETRYRRGEVLVATPPGLAPGAIDAILRHHQLSEADVAPIGLIGQSLRLWRFPASRPVAQVVRELGAEMALASIQPNYIYSPQDDPADASPPAVAQYWLAKLKVDKSLDVSSGEPVRVAVIDTAIDEAHPDLNGSIEAAFDAIGGQEPMHTLQHGTSMAGAIAAHGLLKGVAPTVRILSARALDRDDRGDELGSTLTVMKAVQWAFDHRARILNMSFAGPVEDPGLHTELAAASAKGLVLIGAAGNDGPKAPPRYPGADGNVVAVTATDANDAVYALANTGSYVAVAAPGVDVLLTASNGGYAMETGTSVSAALVSGVAAILIERRPEARPLEVRAWLTKTAQPLASAANRIQVGAGLVDARRAAEAASRSAGPTAAVSPRLQAAPTGRSERRANP